MNERETFEILVARYGATRARHLLGALRVLALYGERESLRRGWISPAGLETVRRDLHLADVSWPSPGAAQEAVQRDEQ